MDFLVIVIKQTKDFLAKTINNKPTKIKTDFLMANKIQIISLKIITQIIGTVAIPFLTIKITITQPKISNII